MKELQAKSEKLEGVVTMDIKEYVPKDKHDHERVEKLKNLVVKILKQAPRDFVLLSPSSS